MKRTLILLSLVLFVGVFSSFAQRNGGIGGGRPQPGGTGNRQTPRTTNPENRNGGQAGNSTERRRQPQVNHNRLLKSLDLTKEQKQQIKQIQKTGKENGSSPEEIRSQINQVLTPEQRARQQEIIERMKDRRDKRREQQDQTEPLN